MFRLDHAKKSRARENILNEALAFCLATPQRLFDSLSLLESEQADWPGQRLFSRLTNGETVQARFSQEPKPPEKSDFLPVLEAMVGPHAIVAEQVFLGWFDQPVKIFSQGADQESLRQACDWAMAGTYAFAEALREIRDEACLSQVLTSWRKHICCPEKPELTGFDFVTHVSHYGPDQEALRADAAIAAIDVLEVLTIGGYERPPGEEFVDLFRKLQSLVQVSGAKFRGKENIDRVGKIIDKAAKDVHDSVHVLEAPVDFYVPAPEELDLANWAIRKRMGCIGTELDEWGYRSMVLPFPGRPAMLVYWNPAKFAEANLPGYIAEILKTTLLGGQIPEGYPGAELNPEQLDVMLTYLKPPVNQERLVERAWSLSEQVRGGLHGISRRGDQIPLNRPEEQSLREMGLSEILFAPVGKRGSIGVKINWSGWRFGFTLDQNCEPQGLEGLSLENRQWLLVFTHSYLAAIKNPERSGLRFLRRSSVAGGGGWEEVTGDEVGEIINRRPHLRALPVGHKCRQMTEPRVEEATRCHCGFPLTDINAAFLQVQSNLGLVDELSPPLKGIVLAGIRRITAREEKPRWGRVDKEDVGEMVEMRLTNPPVDHNPRCDVYMFTFVKEISALDAEPMVVSCPGAARHVLELGEPNF